eukprot:746504-Hanusia_phi.AAC.5
MATMVPTRPPEGSWYCSRKSSEMMTRSKSRALCVFPINVCFCSSCADSVFSPLGGDDTSASLLSVKLPGDVGEDKSRTLPPVVDLEGAGEALLRARPLVDSMHIRPLTSDVAQSVQRMTATQQTVTIQRCNRDLDVSLLQRSPDSDPPVYAPAGKHAVLLSLRPPGAAHCVTMEELGMRDEHVSDGFLGLLPVLEYMHGMLQGVKLLQHDDASS